MLKPRPNYPVIFLMLKLNSKIDIVVLPNLKFLHIKIIQNNE